nr:response regulator [Spirochaetaceae bacterium]
CDYHMAYLNGIETIRKVRTTLNLSSEEQPVILLFSSSEDTQIQSQCKELGIDFHLNKPVKQDELLQFLISIDNGKTQMLPQKKQSQDIPIDLAPKEMKILVAEDNPTNMLLVVSMLEKILPGVIIFQAENGKIAVKMAAELNPDIIFKDVQMPQMDGNRATQIIRKAEDKKSNPKIPIIALSAGAMNYQKEDSLAVGMNNFLTKPIDMFKLKQIVRQYIMPS